MPPKTIKNLLQIIVEACEDTKGEDTSILDLSLVQSYADYILITSGNSNRQVQAVADRIVENAYQKCRSHPLGTEGFEGSQWILIDFGDVVCHVFDREVRPVYHLEDMWPQITPQRDGDIKKLLATTRKRLPIKSAHKR